MSHHLVSGIYFEASKWKMGIFDRSRGLDGKKFSAPTKNSVRRLKTYLSLVKRPVE